MSNTVQSLCANLPHNKQLKSFIMEQFHVITIESKAFQSIVTEIKALRNEVSNFQKENASPLSEKCLDNKEVYILLNINKTSSVPCRCRSCYSTFFSRIHVRKYLQLSFMLLVRTSIVIQIVPAMLTTISYLCKVISAWVFEMFTFLWG